MSNLVADFTSRTKAGLTALRAAVMRTAKEPERAVWGLLTPCPDKYVEAAQRTLLAAGPAVRDREPILASAVLSSAVATFEQARVPREGSALGVAGVLGANAGYITRLVQKDAAVSPVGLGVAAVAVAGGAAFAAKYNKRLLAPTIIGGLASAGTAVLANDPIFRNGTPASEGISHGANMLLGAEALRLLNNAGCSSTLLATVVSLTSGLGQLLLVDGLRN